MKVAVDHQEGKFIDSTIEQLDDWWKSATSYIYKQQRLIHCVEIDGNVFYTGFEQYLMDNVTDIKDVTIRTLTRLESIQETEQSIDEYLERFIPITQNIADQLYGDVMQEQQNSFAQFIEGLSWIVKAMEFIQALYDETNHVPQYLKVIMSPLETIINDIFENVQQNDYVSVGDLLQYELLPLLQKFQNREQLSDLS